MSPTLTGKQIRDETVTLDDIGPEAEEQFSKVKVSSGDTTTDYLSNKITAGTGISININNSGSYETITIENTNSSNTPGSSSAEQIFGSEFYHTQSLGATVIEDEDFNNKISGSTPSIPAGTYRLGWSYNWNNNKRGKSFKSRILVDGASIGDQNATILQIQRTVTDGGDSYPSNSNSGTDQAHLSAGFEYLTFGSAGSHSIQLQVCHEEGKKVTIWNAKIELWRVS